MIFSIMSWHLDIELVLSELLQLLYLGMSWHVFLAKFLATKCRKLGEKWLLGREANFIL